MANQQPSSVSPSVSLNIEAPDVQTPANTYGATSAFGADLQTYFPTPSQPQAGSADIYGHPTSFPNMDLHSANQSLAWESEAVPSSLDPGGGTSKLTTSSSYSLSHNVSFENPPLLLPET